MLNIDDRLIKEVSPKIGPNALSVLLAISIHLDRRTNTCFPSHSRIMGLTGMGKNAVYDALKVLKDSGLLKVEQSIDSKKKQFSRRAFRVNTDYIGVFVPANKIEPLPENREPENREPENREPENRETYQLNKVEPINQIELINNVGETPPAPEVESSTFKEADRVNNKLAAAGGAPGGPSTGPHIRDFVNADTPPQLYERMSAFYATQPGKYELEVIRENTVAGQKSKEQFKQISWEFAAHAIKVGLGRGTFVDLNAAFHQWWGRQKRFDAMNTTAQPAQSQNPYSKHRIVI